MSHQVKKLLLLSIGLILVGSGILGASVYFLYLNGILVLEKNLSDAQEARRNNQAKKNEIPIHEEELKKLKAEETELRSRVPILDPNEAFLPFSKFLLASADGLQLILRPYPEPKSVFPEAQRKLQSLALPGEKQVGASYQVKLMGEFDKLLEFVRVLEKSEWFIEVHKWAVGTGAVVGKPGPTGKDAEKTTTTLELWITTYGTLAAEEATAGPVPPPAPEESARTDPPP